MVRSLFITTVLATAAAGCYSEQPDVAYAATATTPDLVEVSPGVEAIADYDYPVFYSDGLYWLYDGGLWYQSPYYYGGWGLTYNVPIGVRGIRNPGYYAHWRGGAVIDHRGSFGQGYRAGAEVRDHRSGTYRAGPARRPAPMRGAPQARSYRGGGSGFHGGGFHGGGSHGGRR
ncbi:MAG: hypothetical protein ABI467_22280 [Kofleriaceae bacterium]